MVFVENSEGTSSNADRNEQIMENYGDTQTTTNSQPPKDNSITIKLKYINDDLKLVDGKLEELLGDFKRSLMFWICVNFVNLFVLGDIFSQNYRRISSFV